MASEDKKLLLQKMAQNEEDRLFLAKLMDKAEQAGKGYIACSGFMDPHQRSLAKALFRGVGHHALFDGGYEMAERVVAIFLPDYVDAELKNNTQILREQADYPLSLLEIGYKKNKFTHELSHRDYLGAIMNLGIKRETVGDILVHSEFAQIIVMEDMAGFIANNLVKVGNIEVEANKTELVKLRLPKMKTREVKATVASLRLDSLIAEAFSLSRSEASKYIEAGKVFLDFEECTRSAESVKEGNIMTLRGMGRAVLSEVGQTSRKNRIFVTIIRYL